MKYLVLLAGLLITMATRAELVILQYHHVSTSTPAATSISPADFKRHLLLLASLNKTIVDLPSAIQTLRQGGTLPDNAVAITFDDAYESIYHNAFPLLAQRRWPFTVFVNPGTIDAEHEGIMPWQQLREMQQQGATIANHTQDHPYLIQRPDNLTLDAWLTQQVDNAEQRIKQEMGQSNRLLAYPYGEYSLAIAEWLQDHDYLAFGQHSGAVSSQSFWQAIPRYPVAGAYADPDTLNNKLQTLALPVASNSLVDPALGSDNPPELRLTLHSQDLDPDHLRCFASGEGQIDHQVDVTGTTITLTTQATQPITQGRSRYNCTAPSLSKPSYFYWYSQLWINTNVENR
ncbi:polysaccharide deacetylase family protein [Oceanobacter sp. 3_MG-2023]|uniref:polysaccharide deacetylase family protein n=1 Tax=Oceanobacter sp. 3_MG-2023 TaxID=3062622 RepID=UPI0027334B3C|nr:polysaccharide deacetylase family protein [Oceanobacter sp. 3_MG-2023]MDP2504741.1 polysaccharide deacetylase family protein [Oceanobacter sp. 3_MG-2023]